MAKDNAERCGFQAHAAEYKISLNDRAKARQGTWKTKTLVETELDTLLSIHKEGKKDGECIVFADLKDGRRDAPHIQSIAFWYADLDNGQSEKDVRAALEAKGVKAWVYSTFSHLTKRFDKARKDDWDQWQKHNPQGTLAEYLIARHGFIPEVVAGAKIVGEAKETEKHEYLDKDGKPQTKKGIVTRLQIEHAPCPKFRIVGLLSEPWVAGQDTVADFKAALTAFLRGAGLNYDPSSVDISRLHYLPRVRAKTGAEVAFKLDGDPFDWKTTLAELPKTAAGGNGVRRVGSGGATPASDEDLDYTDPQTDETLNLKKWAGAYGHRFQIVNALKDRTPWGFDTQKPLPDDIGGRPDRHYAKCPNEMEHTSADTDADTWVANASGYGGFGFHCHHHHCKTLDGYSRDRLFFLRRMLEQDWLTISDLTDERFLIEKNEANDKRKASTRARDFGDGVVSFSQATEGELEIHGEDECAVLEKPDVATMLYDPLKAPGLVGSLTRWGHAVSYRNTPVPAFAGALMSVSLAMGPMFVDRVLSRKSQRGNLYVGLCAPTGSGKDEAIHVMRKAAEAGDPEYLMEDPRSWPGIHQKMHRLSSGAKHGARMSVVIDEYGQTLRSLKNGKDSHKEEILKQLLSQFTQNRIAAADLADPSKVRPAVENTFLNFMGGSQPAVLADGLTDNALDSGGMNRTLWFFIEGIAEPRPLGSNDPDGDVLPIGVESALEYLYGLEQKLAFASSDAPQVELSPSPGALDVLLAYQKSSEATQKQMVDKGDLLAPLVVRAFQLVKRVALVLAAGELAEDKARLDDIFAPKFLVPLSKTTAEYAVAVVEQSLRDMTRFARGSIGVTEEAKIAERILQKIRTKGGNRGLVQKRDIQRSTQHGGDKTHLWNAAWERLNVRGEIMVASKEETGALRGVWVRLPKPGE